MDIKMSKAFLTSASAKVCHIRHAQHLHHPLSVGLYALSFDSNLCSIQATSFFWIFIVKIKRELIITPSRGYDQRTQSGAIIEKEEHYHYH